VWFLFGDDDYEQFGPEPLNLGVRLSVSVEAEVCDAPVDFELETVSGRSEVWLCNRFRLDPRGNIQNPHPAQETYRYSTDDNRIGIPFQLFNLNTLQVFTQLSDLSRRERDRLMRTVPQTTGRLDIQFEFVFQPDHLGADSSSLSGFALPNPFLVQEVRHPGRTLFVDQPPNAWGSESFVRGEFEINADWNAGGEKLEVNWSGANVSLPTGPNRYNRTAKFPGDKIFMP